MAESPPQVGAPSRSPLTELQEVVPAAELLVGSVVRARRGLKTEASVVIGVLRDDVEVVRPGGELAVIPLRKVRETLVGQDGGVRSVPGRLHRFLNVGDAKEFRPDHVVETVRARLDELTKVREQAIGLLLDRGPLSLSLAECLALPIEPWRVRYEFLAGSDASEETADLVDSIIGDPEAPIEVRALVAIRFGPEPVRLYLTSGATATESLPRESAEHAVRLREVLYRPGSGILRDPVVEELLTVLGPDGDKLPTEVLLADRSVWPLLLESGLTSSASSGPLGEEFAGISALMRSKKALFEWEWDVARTIARDGLRESRREKVRDELLNIVACALWLKGETESALAALDTALEGQYTDALLINASLVATELEHDSAVDRLVKLAREAPSAHQRAVAAERALIFWMNDDDRIWEDDEDEAMPSEIRDALRPLIREGLPADRYQRILRVLANRDDEWLASQPDSAFGDNATGLNRAAIRVFKARAVGIDVYVKALASELRLDGVQDWVGQERDSIVEAATEVLFENNDELAAAFFGLTLIDAKLPMSAEQRVPLKCLTVASITANVDPEESEPNLRFIDLVNEAHRELSEVTHSDRGRFGELVEIAAERLARSYFISRYRQFDEVIDAYNVMMARISRIPSRNLNRQAVREAFGPISEFCTDTYNIFEKLRPLLDDAELEEAIDSMMRQASDIGQRIVSVTR